MNNTARNRSLGGMHLPGRRLLTIVVIVVVLFAPAVTVLAAEGFAGSTNLHTVSGFNIANEVQQAYAWNGSVWVSVGFSATASSGQVVLNVPAGFAATQVVVMTANDTQDAQGLLSNSLIYTTQTLTTTGVNKNDTQVYMYLGSTVNSSALNAIGDKGVKVDYLNQTLLNSNINNFGNAIGDQNVKLNVIDMFASSPSAKPQYVFDLKPVVNKTSAITITFTQEFNQPYSSDLYSTVVEVSLVSALLAGILLVFAVPRPKGSGF